VSAIYLLDLADHKHDDTKKGETSRKL
jgi:hypothetical protein